ncbi:hypothetical protein AVKW3434_22920 [Acidovorax sp. SUPP3434]|nr:hypothetical protein AVKW3434_22920 [Acidovorax sp. SUPP3434]
MGDAVKSLDQALLRQTVREPDWSQIHYLSMDDLALHKCHRYAIVVVDPISRQVLWVGNGRSRDTAATFFKELPVGVSEQIRAVAGDMKTPYELERFGPTAPTPRSSSTASATRPPAKGLGRFGALRGVAPRSRASTRFC